MAEAGIASVELPRGTLWRAAIRSPSFVAGALKIQKHPLIEAPVGFLMYMPESRVHLDEGSAMLSAELHDAGHVLGAGRVEGLAAFEFVQDGPGAAGPSTTLQTARTSSGLSSRSC